MINNDLLQELRTKIVNDKAEDQNLNIYDRLQPLGLEYLAKETTIFPPIFISQKYH